VTMTYGRRMVSDMREDVVQLIDGPRLTVRAVHGPLRPFLLVHDVGADSDCWDEVAQRLHAAGHQVAAVDLRGHGRSETPAGGYDTDTCADDLSTLLDLLGFTGGRSPVVAGHGWGGNIALSLAARRDGVAGVCCLGGGWIRPSWRYPDFEACWNALVAADSPAAALAGPALERRRSVARSLYLGEPRAWYPLITVPVVLCPVVPPDGRPDLSGDGAATRTGVAEAASRLPRARVSWYYGGSDVLSLESGLIADDLLAVAAAVDSPASRASFER
jgi:pimeloyl-ACP methyl ester carboxylesterase